jgi:hypothetical protein
MSNHLEGLWHIKIQIHKKLVISALQDRNKAGEKNTYEKN